MAAPHPTGLFDQKVVVGIADMAVSNNQAVTLATYSLGSCIGVTIYDPVAKVGGLLHVMLPESSIDPDKAQRQPAMFMDTGIPAMFRAAYELKAEKYRVQICVVGGAQVMDSSGFFSIGKRNYQTLCAIMEKHDLKITAEQVGGMVSRSVYLNLATGEVRLKVSGQSEEVVLCRN
ncbi:MAG TPA: chemotaxis protein CheD [Verrucomicrobiales bacterium]|nr:chemotaxis protein CheD [Verrucomicrobiales bacterium]